MRRCKTIYKIYENKYFNNLMLNLIKVRYCENTTIENMDYYLSLNNANKQYDNPINTFKVMLYLCSLLTENGLNENTYIITCDEIHNKLSIGNINAFNGSLQYISSISYGYKLYNQSKWYSVDNIIVSYTHFKGYFKVVFSDEFISLLDRTNQFYQVNKGLLNSDVRYYRHSIFIGNYILLHQRRNKGKHNEFVISIKELVKNCPLLPLYEDLPKQQRQVHRSIIKPFETNLTFTCSLLGFKWQYVDDEPTNYIDFIRSKIVLESR